MNITRDPYAPITLHDEAEAANDRGDFAQAAALFEQAAPIAFTATGRLVLLEKAALARQQAADRRSA